MMEYQLAAYRERKAKERNQIKSKPLSVFSNLFSKQEKAPDTAYEDVHNLGSKAQSEKSESPDGQQVHDDVLATGRRSQAYTSAAERSTGFLTRKQTLVVKLTAWLILWGLFIHVQFGCVFVVLSLFYFVYKSTRTGPRPSNEMSAYSVFNNGCERIDGTFTAEQFDKQLRTGSLM